MAAHPPEYEAWLEEARAHMAAMASPAAAGPGSDFEAVRRAYLDLLKLALCDLAGATTQSVGAMLDGSVMSRELRGDDLRLRVAGMDWPLQGLTMIGLNRLDDLQACVESVLDEEIDGDVIEAGAWRGGAAVFMRALLDTRGDERTVWVADSFQGFPSTDGSDDDAARLGSYDFLAVPVDEVRANFARFGCERNVRFLPGFFEETLGALAGRRWSILHLDADTYEATRLALEHLYPRLAVGGYVVVDDYGAVRGCREAVEEFRRSNGIAEPLEKVDPMCIRWRRQSEAPIAAPTARSGEAPASVAPAVGDAEPRPVPTAREVALQDELDRSRGRLAAVEAELERLKGAPWRGARAWLRRRREHGAPR
jgi:O-methyltransferase